LLGYEVKDVEKDGACSANGGQEKLIWGYMETWQAKRSLGWRRHIWDDNIKWGPSSS